MPNRAIESNTLMRPRTSMERPRSFASLAHQNYLRNYWQQIVIFDRDCITTLQSSPWCDRSCTIVLERKCTCKWTSPRFWYKSVVVAFCFVHRDAFVSCLFVFIFIANVRYNTLQVYDFWMKKIKSHTHYESRCHLLLSCFAVHRDAFVSCFIAILQTIYVTLHALVANVIWFILQFAIDVFRLFICLRRAHSLSHL